MSLISQITRGLKSINIKGISGKGLGKLTGKGTKASSAQPLSMSPLGDNMANLGKHLNGPKQDMVNLAPKARPEAKAPLRRTSPPTPSTPTGREQAVKPQSTSGKTGQPVKSSLDYDPHFQYLEKQYGARRADASTTAALTAKGASKPVAPTVLTTRQRSEKLKAYTAQSREIGQTVKSMQNNPALTPEVKHQLIQEEARKLADVQKKAAAIMTPQSAAQKSVLQSRKTLQANLQASKTGSQGQLPNPPVTTSQARDAAAARLMAQGRALRSKQAQQEQQRLTQAWAADAKAMSQPQVRVPSKNPYINDTLEAPPSSKSGPTFVSDIYPVRSFPGSP